MRSKQTVINYLEGVANSGQLHLEQNQLTATKVLERGTDFVKKDDGIHFTVERHSSIGARYIKGCAMNSMRTYNVRYLFADNNIEDLSSETVSLSIAPDIGKDILNRFGFYRIDFNYDDQIELTTALGGRCIIESLVEALQYAKDEIEGIPEDAIQSEIDAYDTAPETQAAAIKLVRDSLMEAYNNSVINEITYYWNEKIEPELTGTD